MATTDDTSAHSRLVQAIEAERRQLLQANAVLKCLYEVLLHADGEDSVTYAEAAHVAAAIVDGAVERLDAVRIGPLAEALARDAGHRVREARVLYMSSGAPRIPDPAHPL